ncbi:MAG: enoyl-CoA hydratase/isomerase family protein [Gaiellaceae bacterium]
MTSNGLDIEQVGGVLRVRIDAGPGNLFTPDMTAELAALLRTPPDGVHVVHLCASGPDFCLGRAPFRSGAKSLQEDVQGLADVTRALNESRAVTVAEVQGDAAGFGVGLVACSDVAVAAPEVHLSFPEVDAGFAPALVLSWLGSVVGRRKAFWLAATGVRIPAREACDAGLLTHVTDDAAELGATVAAAIELLCAKPPQVHEEIKRLLSLFAVLPSATRNTVAADRLALSALRRADGG